jgi:hypothetical protein
MVTSGLRLRSQVCTTEVVVVRAGSEDAELTCGGHPLVALDAERAGLKAVDGLAGGTQIGKRYTDVEGTIELLVTKAGTGSLGLGSTPLELKTAKPLPASD